MLNIILSLIVIALFYTVILLFAKIIEKVREHKGEELNYFKLSKLNSKLFATYGVLFLLLFFYSFFFMDFASLPTSASNFGGEIDRLFIVTAVVTGIVFVITHIALFYFVWKYREKKNGKATFFTHSNNLEIIWTTVPALAMTILVVMGLNTWYKIFPNKKTVTSNEMVVEVTGKQFNWIIRYPGKDGILGKRVLSKKFITPDNELGIDWTDPASHDDYFASEMYLVKNRPVSFKLGALDVLHSFYLPHFRMKMDCVPGVPTSIGFTPIKTNDESREELKSNSYWSQIDPETNAPRFEKFSFELACAELCGKSHFGMQNNVNVVSQADFDKWQSTQKSFYEANKEKLDALMKTAYEGKETTHATEAKVEEVHKKLDFNELATKGIDENAVYETDGIQFDVNSSKLNAKSIGTLDQLVMLLNKFNDKKIELSSHTDSDGDDAKNLDLSISRAKSCEEYLVSKGIAKDRIKSNGFGETKPVAENTTPEGKQKNRRTEFNFN